MEERIEKLIDQKMDSLLTKMETAFRAELQYAITSIKENSSGLDVDGIRCMRSSAVCSALGISETTLYRMRKANQIGFVLKNGSYFYRVSDVMKFLKEDYVGSAEEEVGQRKRRRPTTSFNGIFSSR